MLRNKELYDKKHKERFREIGSYILILPIEPNYKGGSNGYLKKDSVHRDGHKDRRDNVSQTA
jgi:hypothetical protein